MPQASETLELLIKLKDEATRNLKNLEKALEDLDKDTGKANQELKNTSDAMKRTRKVTGELAMDMGSLQGKTTALGRAFGVMRGGLSRISGAIFSLKGAFASLGIGLLSRSFLNAAASSEQYRTRLTVLLGSVAEGNRLFQSMAEFASGVSFQYQEIMGSATNLAGVMKRGREEVEEYIPLIADLAAASGLGIQETTSQVIRMYSAGAAAADLFRERGVLAMLGFQAGVSVSAEETRKRLVEAWEDPASRFKDASKLLARTWEGMLSMISDAWFQFRNLVMEGGVFDFLKASIQTFLDFIKQLKKEGRLKEWAKDLAESVVNAFEVIIKASALVGDAWRGWQMIWHSLRIGFGAFARYLNLGLAYIADVIDEVRAKIAELGGDAAKIGKILKYTPGLSSFGYLLEQLEMSNTELGKTGERLRQNAQYWEGVVDESSKILPELAKQESYYSKVEKLLAKIRAKAEEYRKEAEKEGEGRPRPVLTPEVGLADRIQSELLRLRATTATALTELGIFYEQNKKTLDEFFNERERILKESYEKEVGLMQQQLKLVSPEEPKKRLKIEDQIFQRRERYTQESLKLTEERRKAELKAATDIRAIETSLADMRTRLLTEGTAGATEARFREEQLALERKHDEEIRSLKDHKASMDQIEEAYRLQQLDKDKLAAEQRQRVFQLTLEGAQQSINYLNEAFGDLYAASGESIKEFFYLQKAAAIAQTIITTYQNAVLAYQQGLKVPVVGMYLAPVFAATAVAAGMAKVAAISAQSLAEGGLVEQRKKIFENVLKTQRSNVVFDNNRRSEIIDISEYTRKKVASSGKIPGSSPHSKADNIPVFATAGEFMHPVKTVTHYGERVMELIKDRKIPREVFSQYLADGGIVRSDKKSSVLRSSVTDRRSVKSDKEVRDRIERLRIERILKTVNKELEKRNIVRIDNQKFSSEKSYDKQISSIGKSSSSSNVIFIDGIAPSKESTRTEKITDYRLEKDKSVISEKDIRIIDRKYRFSDLKRSREVIKQIQALADGGLVAGHSPHSKADNILISATAKEFVHPVDAVKYYGERGMEAIKRKIIPKEVIQQWAGNIRPPSSNYSYSFQSGGPVPSAGRTERQRQEGQSVNVVNVIDPNLMDQYVSTTHGQKNILNVLSQNSFAVKQILSSE